MKTRLFLAALLAANFMYGQNGGNALYGNRNTYAKESVPQVPDVIANNDGATFSISILNNVKADSFVLTLGLNAEALSVRDCNALLNQRIGGFKTALRKMGIREDNFYVDFISQTKIYDYKSKVGGSQINIDQVDGGFEMKKNIILRIRDIALFDRIIDAAADFEIHNIVKVDYFNADTDGIYDAMLSEASKMLERRKKQLRTFGRSEIEENPGLTVSFRAIQPIAQYKDYTAFESANIESNYYKNDKVMIRHEQRKGKTFYFDGSDQGSFDKVMNADTPVVGLQYIMEVSVSYSKDKKKQEYRLITPNGDIKTLALQ